MEQGLELEALKSAVDALGDAVNVISNLLHGGSIFSVWVLSGDFSKLAGLPKGTLLQSLKDVDQETLLLLEEQLKSKVKLQDPKMQEKFQGSLSNLETSVELVYEGIDFYSRGLLQLKAWEALYS